MAPVDLSHCVCVVVTVDRLEDKNENIRKENSELHNKYIDVCTMSCACEKKNFEGSLCVL